jgi:UDP-N-acetylglucosamine:LPS N-acetylglucosamine transferase
MIVFIKERPNAVISNGAGVAVPICYLMRLFGKKVLFIESFCRLKPSLSGKIIYPISSLFLVQWPRMRRHYKKAVYAGSLI